MGRRGPKPTSTAVLAARGSDIPRKKRRGEINLAVRVPAPTPTIARDPEAIEIFRQLAQELFANNVIATIDAEALALLATMIATFRRAHEKCDEQGEVDDRGNLTGWAKLRNSAYDRVVRLQAQFGMTPMSRIGLKPSGPRPTDGSEELIR